MSSPGQIQTRAKDPSNPAPSPSTKSGPNHDQDPSNFKKDDLGNTVLKGSLKDQLNEKAREEWIREVKERQGVDEKKSVVDKVLSAIPGVNSLLGKKEQKEDKIQKAETENDAVLPRRPEHDVQVEQFLRGQYHSRSGDGMPEPGTSDK